MPKGDQRRDDEFDNSDSGSKLPDCEYAVPQLKKGLCAIRGSITFASYSVAFIAAIQAITSTKP